MPGPANDRRRRHSIGLPLMALVWRKQAGGRTYELRRAGASLRLYTDGTFHSQYNPHRPLAGSIWDLLSLPALMMARPPRRVLILGVGGGAVICQLRQLLPSAQITGIELDPVHLQVAGQHFGLRKLPAVELVEADALLWLRSYRGPRFDYIVDDLFGENGGRPSRAVTVDSCWSEVLLRHLNAAATLVVNFESRRRLRESALFAGDMAKRFSGRYSLSVSGYENRIAACFQAAASPQLLDVNLARREAELGRRLRRTVRAKVRRET